MRRFMYLTQLALALLLMCPPAYAGDWIVMGKAVSGGAPAGDEIFVWDCDISSGSGPYTPATGTGTITNNLNGGTSTASGCTGNAIDSNGSETNNGAFTINSANIDLSAGEMTICLKPDYTGLPANSGRILSMSPTSGSFNVQHNTSGRLDFNYGGETAYTNWSPTAGVAYDIKITWGPNHAAVFIDTVEGTTISSLTQPTGSQDWHISGDTWTRKFSGVMDEITIYDAIQ